MLIEIHMLKNYQPTNLNRDDTGAPKTCMFGGVQRGRISSQCLKHSWRTSGLLSDAIGSKQIGVRTRKLPDLVGEALAAKGVKEEYITALQKNLTGIGTKDGKENKDGKTAQVIAYSPEDIQAITDLILEKLENCKTVKDVEKIKAKDLQDILGKNTKRSVTLDMALFGRMVTSDAFADVEAAMQVAHAISTNRVYMESDYFTAVDDLIDGSETETGSAMIGDIDYNSSCYYMYASLDTDKLRENLQYNDDAEEIMKKIVPVLVETMAMTNPSGKQNSFAGHSLPSAVLVECKEKHIPVSYANAFEEPVKPEKGHGLVYGSICALKQECESIASDFGLAVEKRLWFSRDASVSFGEDMAVNCRNFRELLDQIPQV